MYHPVEYDGIYAAYFDVLITRAVVAMSPAILKKTNDTPPVSPTVSSNVEWIGWLASNLNAMNMQQAQNDSSSSIEMPGPSDKITNDGTKSTGCVSDLLLMVSKIMKIHKRVSTTAFSVQVEKIMATIKTLSENTSNDIHLFSLTDVSSQDILDQISLHLDSSYVFLL